jgi:hypothetical protein
MGMWVYIFTFLKYCYSRFVIFTELFLIKYLYLYILCNDWHKLRYKSKVYFQVFLFHICTYKIKHMKFFSPHSNKTALFCISKRLWKGIARMDSDSCVVTNNLRMMQNDASLLLLVSFTYYHAYVMDNRQIVLNNLNDKNRTLKTLNTKN